ncbi:EAL domain-containing protein [Thiolapillus sp.]|uniref:EAL domain-containing protein n=3 Tax=Thiolapillus sp. TaxID=2017437 RepID=UPI003AF641B0
MTHRRISGALLHGARLIRYDPVRLQACLRPRDRFWDIPVPKIDSAFDNLLVPQPSWSPSTTQQLRKLVAAPYLAPNDWTPRSEAYFVFPLAQGTPGKQCGLAATGVYQPSLRSPWLAAVDVMHRLTQYGFRFSIDDFGTGYSSLRYLKNLPLGELKIDKSFVDDVTAEGRAAAIVKTIIDMAHNFNLDVVAEGVESEEQLNILAKYQCELYQGFFFWLFPKWSG